MRTVSLSSLTRGLAALMLLLGLLASAPLASHAAPARSCTVTDLGTFGGSYSHPTAYGINDRGQVVGIPAALWDKGAITDLGTLLGGSWSYAYGINNSGQVVGQSGGHAVLWDKGTITDLGTLPGGSSSGASGINARSQVVGNSGGHAVLWSC